MASELITRDLYKGKFHMVHNPNARGRAPRYKVNDTIKPKGVTTILGQTLAKDLMQWAADMACEFLRDKLPVVTEADLVEAANAYKTKRDAGASTGTEAHAMVEDYLKGRKQAAQQRSEEATRAFTVFKKWYEDVAPSVINVEEVIYSAQYGYAGTYDCMLEIQGKVYLCDLKTTNASRKAPNGVYAENFLQLGAYAFAHEEQRQYEEANGGTKLQKIDGLMVISAKKNGVLDIVTNDDVGVSVEAAGQDFLKVLHLFGLLKEITTALGGR